MVAIWFLLALASFMMTAIAETTVTVIDILRFWPDQDFATITSSYDNGGYPYDATIFERKCPPTTAPATSLCLPFTFTQGPSTWIYENTGVTGGICAE